jgi:hypothetical protein
MLRASATVNGVGAERAHSVPRCADEAGSRGVDPLYEVSTAGVNFADTHHPVSAN